MHYKIYHASVEAPSGVPYVGIEVQPPLPEIAINGIISALTEHAASEHRYIAYSAKVTRNDAEGTALLVRHNPKYIREEGAKRTRRVAEAIGTLLNPCELHAVTYYAHDDTAF
jgi:hypothetical protein